MNLYNKLDELFEEELFEMANLTPKRTGLNVTIWSDHEGVLGQYKHDGPRIKIGKRGQFSASVSIEKHPKIYTQSKGIRQSGMDDIKEAMDYVGRNYDLFLKHFNDTDDSYDDDDLKRDLANRGEYVLEDRS